MELIGGAMVKELVYSFGATPCRRVDKSIGKDLLRVASDRLRDRLVEPGRGDLARRRRQGTGLVEAASDVRQKSQARGGTEVGDGGSSLQ